MNEKGTFKNDWYQTEVGVVIVILAKNVKKEYLEISFADKKVTVNFKQNDQQHNLVYNLSHKIVPEHCSFVLMSSKIEIKLTKAEGHRWSQLEGSADDDHIKCIPQASASSDKPPSYPTSKGTDWNAIEKEIAKDEASEKPAGEEALNQLFQQIYGKGSDEVKRAMNKSFTESGGTVLSTNWDEIARDKVKVKPPDGMEFKKWDC